MGAPLVSRLLPELQLDAGRRRTGPVIRVPGCDQAWVHLACVPLPLPAHAPSEWWATQVFSDAMIAIVV
jgi:hypothetical protein